MIDNINWYKYSQLEDRIFQDASIASWIAPGLFAAFLAVMAGSGIMNAAKRYNVSEIELGKALKDPSIRQQVDYYIDQQNNTTSIQDENSFNIPEKQIQQPQQIQNPKPQIEKEELTKEEIIIIDTIARTVWGEAAGEPYEGQVAVASTIWNRSNGNPKQFVHEIKRPKAYSVWDDGKTPAQGNGEKWVKIMKIAKQMVKGQFTPNIPYESYFNPLITNKNTNSNIGKPYWAYQYQTNILVTPNLKIGEHVFLNPRDADPNEIKKRKAKKPVKQK